MLEHLKKLTTFKNILIYFVVHAVILLAVIFAVIRLALPHVEDNLPHLEKLASQSFDMDIKVEKMYTGWHGSEPTMRFENVTMFNATSHEQIAQVHYFDVQLDLFASIRHWKLIPSRLILEGVTLTVEQQPDGGFRLKNHALVSDRPWDETLGYILAQFKSLEIKNGDFDILLNKGRSEKIYLNSMRFSPHFEHYRFESELTSPELTGKLSIISDIKGDLHHLDQSLIDGYIKINDLEYDARYMPWHFYAIKPKAGQLSLDTWFKWEKGQWEELIGKISFAQVVLQNITHPDLTLPLDLDAEIAWQKLDNDAWRLSGDDIHLKIKGQDSPPAVFLLEANPESWDFKLNTIALNDVLDILTLSDQLDNKARDAITHLKPEGELRELQWVGTPGENSFETWNLGLKLDKLFWQAYGKIPSINNISGIVKLSEHQGELSIDSKNVVITLPNFFDNALSLSEVTGLFAWIKDSQWTLQSQHLSLFNPDIQLDASLSVVVPENTENTTLDLIVTSGSFDQKIAKKYLPTKALPPALVQWINRSVTSGTVTAMKTVIKGPLNQFPYKKAGGEFDMRFALEDVDLSYHSQWPPVQNLSGELVIEGNGIQAFIDRGSVSGSAIKQSTLSLLYAKATEPLIMHLSGSVEGSSRNAENYLRASPLWKNMGSIFELVKVNGPLALDFKADIPLRLAPEQFNIQGTARLTNGSLMIDQWKLGLENVNGELAFTQKSVNAESITGTFLGRPGILSASTLIKNDESEITWNFHSTLDKALIQHFARSHYWNYFEGESEYDARFKVMLPKRNTTFSLSLLSNLEGLALHLPTPLGKTAEQKIPSRLILTFPKTDKLDVEFHYGDHAWGLIDFLKNETGYFLHNAQLVAGAVTTNLSRPSAGMQITGYAPNLSIVDWIDFFAKHEVLYPKLPNESSPDLRIEQLRIDDLQYNNNHINHAILNAHRNPDYWLIGLSSDQMTGNIHLPLRWGPQALLVDLSHCTWPLGPSSTSLNKLTPKNIRPIDFKCAQFTYKNADIGKAHVSIVPDAEKESVIFDPILLESDIDKFSASGTWSNKNGKQSSAFKGKATSANMGKSLRAWGVPTDVEDAKGEAEFNLTWPGSPMEVSAKNVSGDLDVRMQNGRFIGVNPGFGRMLGLLSFQGLQRRMRLDFSDVFKEGFAFDTFKSNISIQSGNAFTTNASIKAPAADINFSGRTGLAAHDLDFDMLVQAHIDSTVPAAAVAIANPAAGAAVWIVDKVFNPLGSVTRYRYHVTGTWDTPIFTDLTKEYREQLDGPAKVEEAK